jgi:DNA-binding transcriptional ArsR family regulator
MPELLEMLSFKCEGYTWRELLGKHCWSTTEVFTGRIERGEISFPRQTLHRHLKALVDEGIVERIKEPRKPGERGKQCTRYRIKIGPDGLGFDCLGVTYPVRRKNGTFYFGTQRTRAYSGTKYVKPYTSEKGKLDADKRWFSFQKEYASFRDKHPEYFAQFLAAERERARKRTKPDTEAVMKNFDSFVSTLKEASRL